MDKISVIIPVYNVEKYLAECVDSVIGQTHANLEIILVDDGSTDASGALCDEYAKKDERIKVIHKSNGGPSSARNAGLENISGKYFAFIDGDDKVSENYLEVLYKNLLSCDGELSVCSFLRFFSETNVEEKGESFVFSGRECFEKILHGQLDLTVVWGKLYKREFFGDFRFKEGQNFGEDDLYANNFYFIKKAVYTSDKLYFYRQNESGIIQKQFSLINLSQLIVFEEREKFLKENGLFEYTDINRKNLLYKITFLYSECKKAGYKNEAKALKKKFKENFDKKNSSFNKKDLFRLKLFKNNPFLYKVVTGIARRIKCRKK